MVLNRLHLTKLINEQPEPHGESIWTNLAKAEKTTLSEPLRDFYRNSLEALGEQPFDLRQTPLIALDIETTGLNAEVDDILSIGVVEIDNLRIRYGTRQHWLLKPLSKLGTNSVSIHGITHDEVAKAPDLAEILPDFLARLQGRIAVVHCAGIEESFLDSAIQYRLGERFFFPALDTMGLERHFHRAKKTTFWNRLLQQNQPPSLRLGDVRSRYGLPHYPAHNALLDALGTAELLLAIEQHHPLERLTLNELLQLR